MAATETELERLESAQAVTAGSVDDVTALLANLPSIARRAVDTLEQTLASGDINRARQKIRDQMGVVTVEADRREIRLYSEQGHIDTVLRRVIGTHTRIDGSGGRICTVPAAVVRVCVKAAAS